MTFFSSIVRVILFQDILIVIKLSCFEILEVLKRFYRFTQEFVANNLLSGPKIRIESDSKIRFINNLEKDLTSVLVNPSQGNLHLTARAVDAINKAETLSDVTSDIDGEAREDKPDIGADELVP